MDINTPEGIEAANKLWWDKHSPDWPFHVGVALSINATDMEIGTKYGSFIAAPMPVSDTTMWGFKTAAARDLFLADAKAGTIALSPPRGRQDRSTAAPAAAPRPKPIQAPPEPEEVDDFDILGDDPAPPPAPVPEAEPEDDDDDFDILGMDDEESDPELDDDGFPL